MASKYWVKLYIEILDDHKMGMLPDKLYRRVIELFLLAGEQDKEGELPTVESMAWRLRLSEEELENDLKALQAKKIVMLYNKKWIVTKFAERQAPVSDAERMRRLRERKQKEQYYGYEPVTNTVTSVVTKRNVDTDTDTDTDKNNKGETDLFKQCKAIFETKKGKLITDGRAFSLMINNFKKAGVTAEDYGAAIDAMDADDRYNGSKPTSYESWAIGYAEKRKNPTKVRKGKRKETVEEMKDRLLGTSWRNNLDTIDLEAK
jgi:hypothetical protein